MVRMMPDDIEKAAHNLAMSDIGATTTDLIERAILAERRRCAAVADRLVKANNNTGSGFESHVAYCTAWNIHNAIMAPTT